MTVLLGCAQYATKKAPPSHTASGTGNRLGDRSFGLRFRFACQTLRFRKLPGDYLLCEEVAVLRAVFLYVWIVVVVGTRITAGGRMGTGSGIDRPTAGSQHRRRMRIVHGAGADTPINAAIYPA
jgi:hypothetical protein